MQYTIVSEIPGRVRVRLAGNVPEADVEPLQAALEKSPAIAGARVYPRIGSVALAYDAADASARDAALAWLGMLDAAAIDEARAGCAGALAPRANNLLMDIAELVGFHYMRRWFLPAPIRAAWTLWAYRKFLLAGLRSLASGRLDVPVLDAAAVGISFVKGDFLTAGSTMFLLNIGEALESYTKARSQHELIYSLLAMPETARRIKDGAEVCVSATELAEGDLVVVRTGMPVCVDGVVERGCAMVNQSALTGEPLAVERGVGD